MNTSLQGLAGGLRINGQTLSPEAATTLAASPAMQQLAGGLRIDGQTPSREAETGPLASEALQPENSQGGEISPEVATQETKDVSARFADTLLGRLINDKKSFQSIEEAQTLLDSIVNTVEEVKDQFGNQAANQVMADILIKTDRELSADNIASAVGGVLQSLQASNQSFLETGGTEEELIKAKDMQKKLKALPEVLNAEAEDDAEASGAVAAQSLSSSLNDYFGLKGEDRKFFTEEFAWRTEASVEAEKLQNSDYFTITVDEFGQGNIDQLINFLGDYLQDEGAADIIKNLSGDDDIFEAVEKVRDYFMANTTLTQNSFGMAQREGAGLEKLSKFGVYLDKYMNQQVNDVIANNSAVKDRMMHYAEEKFGSLGNVPDNCRVSFSIFMPEPSGFGHNTYRGQNGLPVVQIGQNASLGENASPEDYAKYEIGMVEGWAIFNRQLAETTSDPEMRESYLNAADNFTKQYEEMKNAFETNTPSTYKTFSEETLDGYQPSKKTPPGCLVDKTV